jgi:carboxyl-terminal processing protease
MILAPALSFVSPPLFAQSLDGASSDAKTYIQLFQSIYQFILRNYVDEPDPRKLYEGAIKGLFDALGDPHSLFLDKDMMSDLTETVDGSYAGIGLYISKQAPDSSLPPDAARFIEVVSPIEDTPGWKAGIQPGDLLIKIDGETTAPLTTDQASKRIRGPAGSDVVLTIRRGQSVEFDIRATRAIIQLPTVKQALIPYKGKVFAYIRIIDWVPQTADKMKEALASFAAVDHVGLVVDVRSNPGGLLRSVIDVSDLFLASGMIVSTKGRNLGENSEYKADPAISYPAGKAMVILVNKGSASASEIFAGALKDQKRALLLGEKSYGKGSVQQIFPLTEPGFKLTMARYYTPSGENIDKTGIPPDRELKEPELTEKQLESFERLYKSGKIPEFAKKHPEASQAEKNAFADSLAGASDALPLKVLRRMVRDEFNKTSKAPIYDLEFDSQLAGALDMLADPDFGSMLAEAKSVKELVLGLREQTPPELDGK